MRRAVLVIMLLAVSAWAGEGEVKSEAKAKADGYNLVWSDDFEKDGPFDRTKWTWEKGFVRNHEAQWYQPDNAVCKDGFLVIEGRRETKPNPNYKEGSNSWKTKRKEIQYTSTSLKTAGLHSWKYGRFEMRAKIPCVPGSWPAFWTLGEKGEWPDNGEIDIMEFYKGKILANVAWGTKRRWSPKWDSSKKPIAKFKDPEWGDKFHVWRMDWDEKKIRLYVDDELLNETDLSKTINARDEKNPFHQPHTILINLAIGGKAGGDPSKTKFPIQYIVDYVRVYQKKAAK